MRGDNDTNPVSTLSAMEVEEGDADDELLLEPEDAALLPAELGGVDGDVDVEDLSESQSQRSCLRESPSPLESPQKTIAAAADDGSTYSARSPSLRQEKESCGSQAVEAPDGLNMEPRRLDDSSEPRRQCSVPSGNRPSVTAEVAEIGTTTVAAAGQPPMSQHYYRCSHFRQPTECRARRVVDFHKHDSKFPLRISFFGEHNHPPPLHRPPQPLAAPSQNPSPSAGAAQPASAGATAAQASSAGAAGPRSSRHAADRLRLYLPDDVIGSALAGGVSAASAGGGGSGAQAAATGFQPGGGSGGGEGGNQAGIPAGLGGRLPYSLAELEVLAAVLREAAAASAAAGNTNAPVEGSRGRADATAAATNAATAATYQRVLVNERACASSVVGGNGGGSIGGSSRAVAAEREHQLLESLVNLLTSPVVSPGSGSASLTPRPSSAPSPRDLHSPMHTGPLLSPASAVAAAYPHCASYPSYRSSAASSPSSMTSASGSTQFSPHATGPSVHTGTRFGVPSALGSPGVPSASPGAGAPSATAGPSAQSQQQLTAAAILAHLLAAQSRQGASPRTPNPVHEAHGAAPAPAQRPMCEAQGPGLVAPRAAVREAQGGVHSPLLDSPGGLHSPLLESPGGLHLHQPHGVQHQQQQLLNAVQGGLVSPPRPALSCPPEGRLPAPPPLFIPRPASSPAEYFSPSAAISSPRGTSVNCQVSTWPPGQEQQGSQPWAAGQGFGGSGAGFDGGMGDAELWQGEGEGVEMEEGAVGWGMMEQDCDDAGELQLLQLQELHQLLKRQAERRQKQKQEQERLQQQQQNQHQQQQQQQQWRRQQLLLQHLEAQLDQFPQQQGQAEAPVTPCTDDPGAALTPSSFTASASSPAISPAGLTPGSSSSPALTPSSLTPTSRNPLALTPSALTPSSRNPLALTPSSRNPSALNPSSQHYREPSFSEFLRLPDMSTIQASRAARLSGHARSSSGGFGGQQQHQQQQQQQQQPNSGLQRTHGRTLSAPHPQALLPAQHFPPALRTPEATSGSLRVSSPLLPLAPTADDGGGFGFGSGTFQLSDSSVIGASMSAEAAFSELQRQLQEQAKTGNLFAFSNGSASAAAGGVSRQQHTATNVSPLLVSEEDYRGKEREAAGAGEGSVFVPQPGEPLADQGFKLQFLTQGTGTAAGTATAAALSGLLQQGDLTRLIEALSHVKVSDEQGSGEPWVSSAVNQTRSADAGLGHAFSPMDRRRANGAGSSCFFNNQTGSYAADAATVGEGNFRFASSDLPSVFHHSPDSLQKQIQDAMDEQDLDAAMLAAVTAGTVGASTGAGSAGEITMGENGCSFYGRGQAASLSQSGGFGCDVGSGQQ
ncbi:unnamed protein product [Closterium sp. Naga37s-1]|nr:unnamed protein product [Closterium sp. Naga37s-1]